MYKGDFIALMNPAITAVIAVALFILWNLRRDQRYVAVLGMAFASLASGFLLQYLFASLQAPATKLVSNFLLIAGSCLLIAGTNARYRLPPPLTFMTLICVSGFGAFVWFLYVDPDRTMRILIMNYMVGSMLILLALRLRSAVGKRFIDHAIIGLLAIWGMEFFVRTSLVVWFEGPYESGIDFFATLYWITLTLSFASFQLLFSVILFAAIAIDVIDDLKAESFTDVLSGLYNRRGFEERVVRAPGVAGRTGMPFSLVFCDLDAFKSLNDTYGHATGDRAIAVFADCLRRQMADQQSAARIGGEEFAVILPATSLPAARLFAESMRLAIASSEVDGMSASDKVTASFGVAEYAHDEDISALLRRADAALYQAKNSGRDCVRVAEASHEQHKPRSQERAAPPPLATDDVVTSR